MAVLPLHEPGLQHEDGVEVRMIICNRCMRMQQMQPQMLTNKEAKLQICHILALRHVNKPDIHV